MVIIGLIGPSCSGKFTFCQRLEKLCNFRVVNIKQNPNDDQSGLDQKFDLIMEGWQHHTIVYPIETEDQIQKLSKRSYFHLIYIDAPLIMRYKRYKLKYNKVLSYEDFVLLDDEETFQRTQLHTIRNKSKLQLSNHKVGLESIDQLIVDNLDQIGRPFRPNPQVYFMKIAYVARSRSNCMKKSVGAILVDKYNRIVSTSYNGTPKKLANCNEGGCHTCNTSKSFNLVLEDCHCIHAEEGCILEAGIAKARGGSLYTTLFPCVWCSKALVQAGVECIYYDEQGDWDLSKEFLKDLVQTKQIKISEFLF